ncbi:MAG: VWA domain-containing protein [Halanaerobiales bacterium]
MSEKKSLNPVVILALIGVFVFVLIYAGMSLTGNIGKNQRVVSTEKAISTMDRLYDDIIVNNVTPRKEPVSLEQVSIEDSLPDISTYQIKVRNTSPNYIEIFSSPEKAGENKDAWLVEVAREFNRAGIEVGGQRASVQIRSIDSGTGTDYITSGKYLPDAFSPSNMLWGKIIEASGQEITLHEERLVGNVAGVLFSKNQYNEMIDKYGAINQKVITEAVAADEIAMGYTNPFASSTGLNFLLSTLYSFDNNDLLSEKAVNGFESFQLNIPFVAFTTMQMRESARTGVLDGFIMEYQTYTNSPDLRSDYVFTPFGVRHDNPIYEIGQLSAVKKEILEKFVEFCKNDKNQRLASRYGFNNFDDYKSEMREFEGNVIASGQKLWKEKKDAGTEIASVFVADVSGSMDGVPLNKLKESLLTGAQYIGSDNKVGLVTFSSDVNINLPIEKFDLNQRSYFTGAVKDMRANGSTAMFDAIIVASKMLMEEKENNPDAKLMLFVLTDGDTNVGHSFNNVRNMLEGLEIPVYTIGYNADIKVLENLSNINEAASINAATDDVVYKLKNLFNAQM